jgi:hypothetical protein
MYLRYSRMLFCIIMMMACNNKSNNKEAKAIEHDSDLAKIDKPLTGLDAEPTLSKADSLQILYYDNPDGDSLRYTRFFKVASTNDTSLIGSVLFNLDQPFTTSNETINCRSEGKIYLYGRGEPLKTIYFSTRCDSCCYAYFIKDGTFLYFKLTGKVSGLLKKFKGYAKKP